MRLKAGVSVTLLANIVFALSQWIIIAGLNYTNKTDVVGQYAYAIAIAGLFLTIGQLGLRPYLLSSVINSIEVNYVFQVRLISSLLAFLSLIFFSYFYIESLYFWLILVLGIAKVFENLSDICQGYFQRNFNIQQIVYSRIFRSIISPVLFLMLFYYTGNVVIASVGILLSLISTFYFFDQKALLQESIVWRSLIPLSEFKSIAVKAFPMGVAAVLVILVVNIPLFVLKENVPDQVIGTYASIFYFVTAGSLILQSAMQVISPIITHHLKQSSIEAVRTLVMKSYFMAAIFGGGGIVLACIFGTYVLTLVYGDGFSNSGDLLMIAAFINLSLSFQAVGGVSLTSFGEFKYQMYCMFFTIPICYFSSAFFIPLMGVQGALWSGVLSSFIVAVLFFVKLFKKLKAIEKN